MLGLALRPLVGFYASRVARSAHDPAAAQERCFARPQRVLSGSEVSRASGFDSCRSLADVRALLPTDAGRLAPLVARVVAEGASAGPVFGRSPLVGFGRTSGTTGEPRLVPLTRASLKSLGRTHGAVLV